MTTELRDVPALRIPLQPQPTNGLVQHSQIMIDKITAVASRRIGPQIGRLSNADLTAVDRALAMFLGLV